MSGGERPQETSKDYGKCATSLSVQAKDSRNNRFVYSTRVVFTDGTFQHEGVVFLSR